MWKVNHRYLVVVVLFLGGCCGSDPVNLAGQSKTDLVVRVRAYVMSILECLGKNPTDEEFQRIISSKELTSVLRRPNGFHRTYTLRVCASKQFWIDPLLSVEPLTMVTVVFDSNQGQSLTSLFFDASGKEMSKEGLPKSMATFITVRVSD